MDLCLEVNVETVQFNLEAKQSRYLAFEYEIRKKDIKGNTAFYNKKPNKAG